MKKYVCSVCGYVYDEAVGIPKSGISAGTKFEDLPSDWICPVCGASKSEFSEKKSDPVQNKVETKSSAPTKLSGVNSENNMGDIRELSAIEAGIICSNLARGCEKQYMQKESELFTKLSKYYTEISPSAKDPSFDELLKRVVNNLNEVIPAATAVSSAGKKDRGALRAIVWSEKITKILKVLLTRYEKEGDAWLDNTGIYVCTVCGFIYAGDSAPERCPVCSVPNWKFEKIEKGEA